MSDDDLDAVRVGRHSIESAVHGGGGTVPILDDPEHVHHLRAEVSIEVSGAETDRPHTAALLEAIEEAVAETIDEFDGGDE